MTPFTFNSVTDVQIGAGAVASLGEYAGRLGMTRALIVTDHGIEQAGLLSTGLASLDARKIARTVFNAVEADPSQSNVMAAVYALHEHGCDGVIGYGGGSSMDVAKLVAALASGEQLLADMYGVGNITCSRLPLIHVPTTAGTGSEATMVAVVTTGATTKAGVVSRTLLADCAILDPQLTLGLPPHVTAATGIDAMVHAIEAYTSARLKNPLSDMLAKEALRRLSGAIETAVHDGHNEAARFDMLFGAMLAGQAFANAPVAGVHALAYPLSGIYHIAHGLSNSLVLPHVLRFNAPAAETDYRALAPYVLPREQVLDDIEQFADHFAELAKRLNLPTRLRDVDVPESAVATLAKDALKQQRLLINNPREITLADAHKIYATAW